MVMRERCEHATTPEATSSAGCLHTAPTKPWEAAQRARTQAAISSRAHYMLGERQDKQHHWLGVPATALTAVVAGFAFSEPDGALTYVIGGLATIAAGLIGIVTPD
jgi:hypothetical protein